jgi:hypothetical protein
LGVLKQTTSSATFRSASQTSGSATGTATTTRAGSSWRTACTALAVRALAALELAPLLGVDRLDPLDRDVQRLDELLAEHARAARGDRAERELLVPGDAELAHEEDVERRGQRTRDLEGDRHPAARQRQHDDVVAPRVLAQALREQPARLDAIPEALPDGSHPTTTRAAAGAVKSHTATATRPCGASCRPLRLSLSG